VGLVGPRNAISLAESWLLEIMSPIAASTRDSILFPGFPGFESAFHSRIQLPKALREEIPQAEVDRVVRMSDSRERVVEAANLYESRLEPFTSLQPRAAVVICAIPKEME